jgi:hypothetical protein
LALELPDNTNYILISNDDDTWNLVAPTMELDPENMGAVSEGFVADHLSTIMSHSSLESIMKHIMWVDAGCPINPETLTPRERT